MSLVFAVSLSAQSNQTEQISRKCHWWQFGHCDEGIEGLPPEAPRQVTVITIDVTTNNLYLFKDGQLIVRSPAATGSERLLKHGSRVWLFRTPHGHLKVLRKIEDPIWRKPDWAFVEAGERVPPRDSPKRTVKGHLGKYALDLGDGILIHGTSEPDSIGRKASPDAFGYRRTCWSSSTRAHPSVPMYSSSRARTSRLRIGWRGTATWIRAHV